MGTEESTKLSEMNDYREIQLSFFILESTDYSIK